MEEFIEEDITIVPQEEIIGEGENARKRLVLKGIFSEANSLNRNKRVYPKAVLREIYTEAMERSRRTGKPIFGELEHSSKANPILDRIAVKFPVLEWDEEKGQIIGEAVPTSTPAGNIVKGLAEDGFPICFSTKMSGKVTPLTEEKAKSYGITESIENCVEVMPGARLLSIDVVGEQSCQKAISTTVYEGFEGENSNGEKLQNIMEELFC